MAAHKSSPSQRDRTHARSGSHSCIEREREQPHAPLAKKTEEKNLRRTSGGGEGQNIPSPNPEGTHPSYVCSSRTHHGVSVRWHQAVPTYTKGGGCYFFRQIAEQHVFHSGFEQEHQTTARITVIFPFHKSPVSSWCGEPASLISGFSIKKPHIIRVVLLRTYRYIRSM